MLTTIKRALFIIALAGVIVFTSLAAGARSRHYSYHPRPRVYGAISRRTHRPRTHYVRAYTTRHAKHVPSYYRSHRR